MPDRAAIVTGASRGIGFALADALGEEGYALTVCARKPDSLVQAAEEPREPRGRTLLVAHGPVLLIGGAPSPRYRE